MWLGCYLVLKAIYSKACECNSLVLVFKLFFCWHSPAEHDEFKKSYFYLASCYFKTSLLWCMSLVHCRSLFHFLTSLCAIIGGVFTGECNRYNYCNASLEKFIYFKIYTTLSEWVCNHICAIAWYFCFKCKQRI